MNRHGRPDEEMFLNKPSDDCDSPTVEPLRIFKPQSPTPGADQASGRFQYPAPPSSKPTFPLPPGASSSAAPLPYPDDEDLRIGQSSSSQSGQAPYPTDERRPSAGRTYTSPVHAIRTDDFRNDTSPRLDTSPGGKKPGLGERRGTVPKPLSPGSPSGDAGLFAKPIHNNNQQQRPSAVDTNFPDYQKKPYYPPPRASSTDPAFTSSSSSGINNARPPPPNQENLLSMPIESGVNRFASTASTSTTKASRGSPPPPETPIVEPGNVPGGGIEARYAAAGISGTATLNSLQSAAAAQRLAQYGQQQQQ